MTAGGAATDTALRRGKNSPYLLWRIEKEGHDTALLALRNPFEVARAIGTLDILSGGRVALGAGTGWMKDEYDLYGVDFATRGQRMDEMIESSTSRPRLPATPWSLEITRTREVPLAPFL